MTSQKISEQCKRNLRKNISLDFVDLEFRDKREESTVMVPAKISVEYLEERLRGRILRLWR
jgi:hypothetical protein